MQSLLLSLPSLGERHLLLKDLDGRAELFADPGDPGAARALLGRVLAEPAGGPVALGSLLATWRDRALAALFQREFGSRIDSHGHCASCDETFAFAFSLDQILAAQNEAAAATGLVLDPTGHWILGKGARLRPPTLGDIAAHGDPDALVHALSDGTVAREAAEAVLDTAAPLLSVDLETQCPHCGERQALLFEIAAYCIESLAGERPLLIRETHLIASRYGWGHDTIMVLPRGDRRAYANLIVGERSVAALRRAG